MKQTYCCFFIIFLLVIPCAAQVIIVDANGTGDYPTIQEAINAAKKTGDIIELQQGTYKGIGNRDIDFLGKAITVRSTNPEDPCVVASTVIDCQEAGRGFYFHSGEDANSILNGLKITNGYVTTSSPGGNIGGGICCTNQSGPTIANCDISGNVAFAVHSFPSPSVGLGGGLYGSNGTITNCIISGNTANGIELYGGRGGGLYACNGTIINCTISGNTATEGGLGGGLGECNGTIINCNISGNSAAEHPLRGGSGGGLYGCNGTITNCTISGNTVDGGSPPNCQGGGLSICNGTITNCTIIENICVGGGLGGGLNRCDGTIINCTISGNTAGVGGGLYMCNNTIANCTINGNMAYRRDMYGGFGGGLCECDATITNCTISGNAATGIGGPTSGSFGGGLFLCSGSITNLIVWGNSSFEGPEIYDSSVPNYSCIKDWIGGGIGNIDADPCFVDPKNDDYHLLPDSPCIDAGDPYYVTQPNETDLDGNPRIFGGRIDMGAYEYWEPTIIYVDANAPGANDGTSWKNAFRFLQDAIVDADSTARPVEIRIAQGIYKPDQGAGIVPGDQMATFQLINGVALKGGYAGYGESDPNNRDIEFYITILSGDLNGDDGPYFSNITDNSIHIVTGNSTEPNAVLDGLTISSGRGSGLYNYAGSPTVADCTFSDNYAGEGGGMYNAHFSDPVVTNCKFSFNLAAENGGAMYNENSNPVVTGCTFVDNSIMPFSFGGFGGAVYNEGCNPTFDYCTFSENESGRGGGGMHNNNSSPRLTNCTFEGNWSGLFGGGFDTVSESSNPILIGCTFIGNSSDYSGGGTSNGTSSLTLINCLFVGNSAANRGGAMYGTSGRNIDVSNCTFYGNEAPDGNMLACFSSNFQFTNCIIWDGGNEIWNPRGSIITLTYSDVYGGRMSVYDPCETVVWGVGNIDDDPCFADVDNGDYHLKSQAGRWEPNSKSWVIDDVTSPCIDAGNPGCPLGDEPTPNGNRRNMGGYGGTAEASKSPPNWRSIADMTNDWVVDSNDLRVFVDYWLESGECIPADLDRSQFVDFKDFALLTCH